MNTYSGANNRTRYSPGAPGHQQTLSRFERDGAEVEHCANTVGASVSTGATIVNPPQLPPPEHHGLSDG